MYETESQVLIIYHPTGEEKKIKQRVVTGLNGEISPEQVIVRERKHGMAAYVELPSSVASIYLKKKSLSVDGKTLSIRPFHCDHQIFINKLPTSIGEKDVRKYFEQFGEIINVQIEKANHSYEAKHCYIKFAKDEDADKVIYHEKRHMLKKDEQFKVRRTYTISNDEQTDKKFFLKLEPQVEKPEQMERQLHDLFRKYGELRERIHLDESNGNSSKGFVTFISQKEGEEAFQKQKETKIGKYCLTIRPYASDLAIFAGNLKRQVTEEDVKKVFQEFGRVLDCRISSSSYSRNVIINYADEEDAKQVLAAYPYSRSIASLFKYRPKLNIHMTLKERNEYKDFTKEKKKKPRKKNNEANTFPYPFLNQGQKQEKVQLGNSSMTPRTQFQPGRNMPYPQMCSIDPTINKVIIKKGSTGTHTSSGRQGKMNRHK